MYKRYDFGPKSYIYPDHRADWQVIADLKCGVILKNGPCGLELPEDEVSFYVEGAVVSCYRKTLPSGVGVKGPFASDIQKVRLSASVLTSGRVRPDIVQQLEKILGRPNVNRLVPEKQRTSNT